MIGQAVIDEMLAFLASVYYWGVQTVAINGGGFTITWFELWVSLTAVQAVVDILLVPFMQLRSHFSPDEDRYYD